MSLRIFPSKTINYVPFWSGFYHFPVGIPELANAFTALPFTGSGAEQLLEEIPGHISTTRVFDPETDLLKGQHNCNHLQLTGDLVDTSFMPAMPSGYMIPLNSYKLVEGFVRNSTSIYQVCLAVAGPDIYRQCMVCAITAPSYSRRSFVNYMRWVLEGSSWTMYQEQVQPVFNTTADVLAFLPQIRTALARPTFGSVVLGQPSNPVFSISSSQSLAYVINHYQKNSFDWYGLVSNRSEVSSEISIPRLFEEHYYALVKIPQMNENAYAFSKDVVNFLKECKALFSLIRGNPSPKKVADLFLSMKYGPPQTIRDIKKVFKTLSQQHRTVSGVSAMDSFAYEGGSLTCMTTIRYHAKEDLSELEKIGKLLRYLDADITFANIWELIPFSFVVDWFSNIDASLTRRELKSSIEYYDIDAVYDTVIFESSIDASALQSRYKGMVNFRHYNRFCSADAHFPLVVPKEPALTSHWLEGLALIIQRLF